MPYTINRTNGALITVVNDGTINTSALDITLIGKNYTGYGEAFNENFVKLLENFSGSSKPAKPLTGQLYYDSVNRKLELYTNTGDTKWKTLGVIDVRSTSPSGPNSGDLWFNPNEQGGRLYVRNNTTREWVLVGPINSRGAASGAITQDILAQGGSTTTTILKLVSDGEIVSFISDKPRFVVDSSEGSLQTRFPEIRRGITFSNTDANGVSFNPGNELLSSNHILWGTAGSALGLVRPNGASYTFLPATTFLTAADLASSVGPITVNDDTGVLVGAAGVLRLHVTAPNNTANISVIGGDAATLRFNVYNGTNQFYNIFSITTGTNNDPKILPNSSATVYLGIPSQRFGYGYINTVTSNSIQISGDVSASVGTITTVTSTRINATEIYDSGARVLTTATIGGSGVSSLTGTANKVSVSQSQGAVTVTLPNTLDITVQSLRSTGSSQVFGAWTLAAGATFQATYADLAERYHADRPYESGTVLVIGGSDEVTTTTIRANTAVAGIVSTNPAYTLNAQAGNDLTHPYIALKGRVPCKVIGPILKGDLLVTSSTPGYAERAKDNDHPNAVLGRALQEFGGGEGVIEVMVV
jgi:hypothetical protein